MDLGRSSSACLYPPSTLIGKKRAVQLRILGPLFPAAPFPPSSRWVVYGSVLGFIELLVFLIRSIDSSDRSCWCAWIWGGPFSWLSQCLPRSSGWWGSRVVQLLCLEVEWCCDGCCGGGLDQGLDRSIWAVRGLVVLEVLRLCMGIVALIVCGLSLNNCCC
ncbi:hypothetical protein ACOSP7_016960 [Xanthoceras sorbifolium]